MALQVQIQLAKHLANFYTLHTQNSMIIILNGTFLLVIRPAFFSKEKSTHLFAAPCASVSIF